MSWVKLDDQIGNHAKTLAAGNEAFGAWVRMVAHCAAFLTDGFVAEAVALNLSGGRKKMIEQLVTVGFLDKVTGGYSVHDYLDWNPPAAQVREERRLKSEKKAEAGRAGGRRSGEARRSKSEAESKQTGSKDEANGKRNEAPSPSPSPERQNQISGPSGSGDQDQVLATRAGAEPTRERPDGLGVQASRGFGTETEKPDSGNASGSPASPERANGSVIVPVGATSQRGRSVAEQGAGR